MVSDDSKKSAGGDVKEPRAPVSAGQTTVQAAKRIHAIELESLILHKYSEHDALFKKADKVAREIIESELREGEAIRTLRPGSYRLFLPKMKPEAGALRCSVIAEQVARAVKELNPTSQAIERDRRVNENTPPPAAERRIAKIPTRSNAVPTDAEQRNELAVREAANRALAAMAKSGASQGEEFAITEADKSALESLGVAFHPVWHAKNNLITAYHCALTRQDRRLQAQDAFEILPSDSPVLATAKLDATLYGRAVKAMQYLLSEGMKAVLIVPVHFSTVDRLRYMGALLEAGSNIPDDAKNLMVFELMDLPPDMSRFRLREPVNYLRTRVRALIARAGFGQTEFDLYKEFNFHGVSVNLNDYSFPEARILKNFDTFAALAEKHKLQSFVNGISRTSMAVGAMASGFTYIEGAAISEPVDNPKQIRPYEIDMLYQS
ncbi:MAG: hypothetical protein K2P94_12280 [Rhodospirillaceae bacterium]|nr:hypothetical protein [Rhodospirillaceae bacterium]